MLNISQNLVFTNVFLHPVLYILVNDQHFKSCHLPLLIVVCFLTTSSYL